jgi:hypothetical protein
MILRDMRAPVTAALRAHRPSEFSRSIGIGVEKAL